MATRDRKDQQDITRRASAAPATTRDSYLATSRNLDPFNQFRRLSDQMERWFESFAGIRRADRGAEMSFWAPDIETFMRDDKFVVRVDLPGLKKDDVKVDVTDDRIVIQGERQKAHEEQREGFYRSERVYGSFYREVPLPEGALAETAEADYKDGVLEITVTAPPREVTQPRRIEIGGKASSSDRPTTKPSTE